MTQLVEFEGRQHAFPDDFSQQDIAGALSSLPTTKPKEDVSAGMALSGVPVLGAYVPKAEAAIRALAQPLTGVGAEGESLAQRYAKNLPEREAVYKQAEKDQPIASAVAKGVGSTLALAPVGGTALGARLLGMTGGSLSGMAARGALSGAGLSAADAVARGEDPLAAAKVGGITGAAFPVVGRAIGQAITPFTTNAPRQAAVNALEAEGVNALTAGQRTGSKPLQWFEQALGDIPGSGRGATTATEQAAEQFTGAALRRAGENANRATPDVIDRAFTRIGGDFDRLGARNTLTPDQQFGQDIQAALADYHGLVSPPNRAPAIQNFLSEIGTQLQRNNGVIPGDAFQSLTSRIGKASRAARGSPEVADTLRDMREALNSSMERSIARTNPQDFGAWRQARNQYRNMLVLEKAATGAGENAANGLISPAQLRNAVVNQGRRAYARGNGDFAELARSGEAIMRPLPQSGTAPRAYAQHLPAVAATGLGALFGGAPGAALGAGAAIAGPPVAGRILMSRPMQRYLANQLVNRDATMRQGAFAGRAIQTPITGLLSGLGDQSNMLPQR